MSKFWTLAVLGLLASTAALTGCGDAHPFSYVPVKGSVKYEDGSLIPADNIKVIFHSQTPPKDPKMHPHPGVAKVNVADGTFTQATSQKPDDGIVPGLHKVTVQTLDKDHQIVDMLPPEYGDPDQTPLKYDTTSGEPANFTVKKKQ
jgi:hypothetical protein